jgi:hypothetical protein
MYFEENSASFFNDIKTEIKKQEDKHFDFECDGCNGYKDLGPA